MEIEGSEDDLLAELNAALDGAGKPPAVEGAAEGETPEQKVEREYVREGRRFVAKEPKEPAAEPAVEAKTEPKPDAPAKQWKPLWYKEEYGKWETLAEPFRKALETREKEAMQGIEKHATAAKAWEPLAQKLAPYAQELAASGSTPQQYVENLVNADNYLRTNPVEAMNWICQTYLKTDIIGLADWMAANGQQPQRIDPIQQELAAIKSELSQYKQQGQNAQRAALEAQIQDWSKDKPHFADVRELMASLAQAPANRGATLDQLYESALHAHPQLRQRILEDQRAAEIAKARAAGATSPRGGAQTNGAARKPTMTLQEELAARFDGLM